MSASSASSRMVLRQTRRVFSKQQYRQASSTTEKAGEAASKVKDVAQNTASKASEGLTKVTSSAGSSVSNAAASAQSTINRIGGRTGRAIKFVESIIPPTIYYGRVGLELGKMMIHHQRMIIPNISRIQSYLQPVISNVVKNPKNIAGALPGGNGNQVLQNVRNTSGEQLRNYAIIVAQVLGFFTVGEMIGRLKLVGYHGEVHSEH